MSIYGPSSSFLNAKLNKDFYQSYWELLQRYTLHESGLYGPFVDTCSYIDYICLVFYARLNSLSYIDSMASGSDNLMIFFITFICVMVNNGVPLLLNPVYLHFAKICIFS